MQGSICYGLLDGIHDFEMAIDMFTKDGFNLGDMVTHKYNLKDIQTGFETAYDKTSGSIKVQIHQ